MTNERKQVTASYTPVWAVVFFGVLASSLFAKELAGSVPLVLKPPRTQRQRVGWWMVVLSGLVFLALFALPYALVGWGILTFVVLLIVGGGMVCVNSDPVQAKLSSDQMTVTIKNVDARFAEEVRKLMLAQSPYYQPVPAYVATAPYQVSPAVPSFGNTGIPPVGHGPGPSYPAPTGSPHPVVANAPAAPSGLPQMPPGQTFTDPFQS